MVKLPEKQVNNTRCGLIVNGGTHHNTNGTTSRTFHCHECNHTVEATQEKQENGDVGKLLRRARDYACVKG